MTAAPRHFLDLDRFPASELRHILELGKSCKSGTAGRDRPLDGKAVALVFEKPSTRTRVSFEVGIRQLGAEPVVLEPSGTQLGRGETVADTARVLSRYVDVIMLRTTKEEKLLELAEHASVPVINGLTDRTHPCQLMADVMTLEEHLGPIGGRVVTWSGDGNNMATSWIHAAVRFDFELRLACPEALSPPADVLAEERNGEGAEHQRHGEGDGRRDRQRQEDESGEIEHGRGEQAEAAQQLKPGAAGAHQFDPAAGQEERRDQQELAGVADQHHLHRRQAALNQPFAAAVDDGEAAEADQRQADAEHAALLEGSDERSHGAVR